MSTSDSDYSIDWLASEEEDSDRFISPQRRDTQPPPSSSTTTTTTTGASFTQYPRSHCGTVSTTTSLSNNTDGTFKDAHADRPKKKGVDRGDTPGPRLADTPRASGYTCTGPSPLWTPAAPRGAVSGRPRHAAKRAHSPDPGGRGEEPDSKETESVLFSHKCVELQRYVQPLASILQGLSSGRYSQRLSSFQESVAMDRIQRILGVLQNPNMGRRFLGTLLQIEKMLQSWFPNVKPRPTVIQSEHSAPAQRQKRHHTSAGPPLSSAPSPSTDPASGASSGPYSATSLKWLHTSPICSSKTAGQKQSPAAAAAAAAAAPTTSSSSSSSSSPPPPPGCTLGATQDSAVSSSTDGTHGGRSRRRAAGTGGRQHRGRQAPAPPPSATPPPPPPPPFKLRSPCLERLLQAKDSVVGRGAARRGGAAGAPGGGAKAALAVRR